MIDNVIKFAKSQGYVGATFDCDWNGYSCYSPLYDDSDASRCVGAIELLEDVHGNCRMATTEEFYEIIDSMPDE